MHHPHHPVHVPLVTQPMGILASLRSARRNVLSIIPEIATRQPMITGRTGKRWHMVMDPGAIRHILLEKLDNYPKSIVTKNLLRPAIGDSLFIAEGAHWRWQRRAVARQARAAAPWRRRSPWPRRSWLAPRRSSRRRRRSLSTPASYPRRKTAATTWQRLN